MADQPSQAWLEFSDGRLHWLDKSPCTIGRAVTNALVLDFPGISRSHAMIQTGPDGGYVAVDLHSTNGTYVSGLRLTQTTPLRDGDKIELGSIALGYRCQQTPGASADSGATSIQMHSGNCWIILLDLIGHTTHTQAVGIDAATADFKKWIELIRPALLHSGGNINAYLGDAVLAYWREDRHHAENVATACQELVRLQAISPRPFRLILHHAPVRISGGLQGESLSGSEVIFLFRIEKSTKALGAHCVLTEAAVKTLNLAQATPLGHHPVRDYPGEHAFFTLKAN
jgi:pSer/pThr/pTyr-binding forkhead associated (FHA) protein